MSLTRAQNRAWTSCRLLWQILSSPQPCFRKWIWGRCEEGSVSGNECVIKAHGGVGDHRSKQPGFNLQICCLLAV